ncbi:MFS transporter [Acuticoccus sp. MNP-M23]|uniref:MFS transporter n=1 Tax=Acuticoccus sp. MNP-M23 TaxID=3072793 RepID=UPI00281570E3|nr:MFS transporter [Acuticoccus sp. MNP-M23]WMS43326.1 MFS transporter [Acuticoccus sp. MNP-M23]
MVIAATTKVSLGGALKPVTALLIGTALLYLGYGLQTTLVPLRAEAEGFSQITIGLLGAAYYGGFVVGCLFAPYVIMRAGHIRAFAAMVSCVSAAALVFPLAVGEVQWLVFRFLVGACISIVLVIVESWLNEKSSAETRGAVMSTYIIITYGAITVGQLGVTTQPLDGFALFSLCSILLSVAAVPVALTRATQPAPIPSVQFRPGHLWHLAPAAFVGAFASGLMIGSVLSLSAVFAVGSGFTTGEAAVLASAVVLGGALGQYPFGRTSDYLDRRLVLLVSAGASVTLAIFLMAASAMSFTMVVSLGFAFGFVTLPSYSLAAAHAYDWTEPHDLVEVSAGMNLLFGAGSTVGPVMASVAMIVMGPSGLFLVAAIAAGGLGVFIGLRILVRRRPADAIRTDFDLYATAALGAVVPGEIEELVVSSDDSDDDDVAAEPATVDTAPAEADMKLETEKAD